MPLAPGHRLGPYEILGPLGAGGMGEVYRARDTRLGREVAVKVLPAAYSTDPDRLRRFEQEARAAAALNHPNILVIYDVGTHEGSPYVVSELLEGSVLRARLTGGALPPKKAVEIALDVARGLAAAHAKGITHRDLKPENLFVTRDGRVKILDFGLAKLTQPDREAGSQSKAPTRSTDTDPGMILGTAGYMAPEQIRGGPADARADIFALGAVLYEMLSGRRPFHKATPVETMNAILNEDPPEFPPSPRPIPPALERIVWHCLEKDPGARFQSARDVAFNLEALSGLSEPSSGIARPAPIRRRARPALLAAALLLLLVAAFALGRVLAPACNYEPEFAQVSFQPGAVFGARFAPDGETYVYSGSWGGGPMRLFSGRMGSPEKRELGIQGASLLSISSKGEMALSIAPQRIFGASTRGTLARAPLEGGAPREMLPNVLGADWSPDGSTMAVIHDVDGTSRLEYPIGRLRYESKAILTDLRISPDGQMVGFMFHPFRGDDRGTVMVLGRDGKARTLTREWSSEAGLAWSPSGREIWFTAGPGSQRVLYAVSLSGAMRVVGRAPGGLTIHDVARDGRVLLAADEHRADIYGIVPGDERERNLTWLDFSVPADISPDGKSVVFTEEGAAAGLLYQVFLRGMDGTPAIRLGEGEAIAFSPDGHQVLTEVYTSPPKLVLLPTGAGEPRALPNPGFDQIHINGQWMPDGESIVFGASEHGKPPRCFVQSIKTGAVRAITPEGIGNGVLSARGDTLYAGGPDRQPYAFPTNGGPPRRLTGKGLEPQDTYLRFGSDGRTVYLTQPDGQFAKLYRFDALTRRRTLVRELRPPDTSGLLGVRNVVVSRDGRTIAYMARRYLAKLYVATGLR